MRRRHPGWAVAPKDKGFATYDSDFPGIFYYIEKTEKGFFTVLTNN